MRAGKRAGLALAGFLTLICQTTLAVSAAHAAPAGQVVQQFIERLPASLLPRQLLLQARQSAAPRAIPPAAEGGTVVSLDLLNDPAGLERTLREALRTPAAELRLSVPGGQARLGDFSLGSTELLTGPLLVLRGNADIYGQLRGNVVTLDGDIIVHAGATISGDALALGGRIREIGGTIAGQARAFGTSAEPAAADGTPTSWLERFGVNAAGLAGVFASLTLLGFLLVVFAKPNLETVSDTVAHSFGRSFVVGMLGQVLLVPTFGMLVVGLILSVVGALLVPFVVIVYALLAIIGIVGGFLAVAHAMGEKQTRRRMAQGLAASPNSFRYMLTGLATVLSAWLAWLVFGWVPVAGTIVWGAAVLVTWIIGTVGFGAAILSRGGVKPQFAGRYISPETMTDEYLWATPQFGVSAVKRPEGHERKPKSGT